MLPTDGVAPARLLGRAVGEQRGVTRAVELRPRVVGHAAVDRDVGRRPGGLDDADAVERAGGMARDRAAGLEDRLRGLEAVQAPRVLEPLEQGADEVRDLRRPLVLDVANAEPAAEVDHARLPAELSAAVGCKGAEP